VASRLERIIAKLILYANRGDPEVSTAARAVSGIIDQLELILPEASSLRVNLAMLHGEMGNYMGSLHEAERLLQIEPDRSRYLMLAGIALLNMCDFPFAKAVFDTVVESSELTRPSTEQESELELLTAEQFRQLWIPHYQGKPISTLRRAPDLIARARHASVRQEAGIIHRVARAQSDLATSQNNRDLLSKSLRNHRKAMRLVKGEYNFHMPMAEHYTLTALGFEGQARSWHETHELAAGLNDAAQAHIYLLESRWLRRDGRYFEAVEQATRAIDVWHMTLHLKGMVDALTSRAQAYSDIGTHRSIVRAAEDIAVASAIASGRGFDISHEAMLLRPRCAERLEGQDKLQIEAHVAAIRSQDPHIFQSTESSVASVITAFQQH
jgi:tetratricopeptide (TPR) repeat protein